MVQLWVNLPARDKSAAPGYQDLRDSRFPRVQLENQAGEARIIAGSFHRTAGPATTFTPNNVWDLQLQAGVEFDLTVPEGHTCVLIMQRGQLAVSGELLKAVELAEFERTGETISVCTETESRALLLTGEPIDEPVAGQGPFVMNTREEIQQAIRDYQAGRMGTLPSQEGH